MENSTNTQPDKLTQTVYALQDNPALTDAELAELLGLERPAVAQFYRAKALELINAVSAPAPAPSNPAADFVAGMMNALKQRKQAAPSRGPGLFGSFLNSFHRTDDNGAAPVRSRSASAPLVDAETYEDDMHNDTPPTPQTHFERYRTLIDSFDEDRETGFEKLVRWFLLLLAYALPLVVAYAMGKEIGDAYGGVFSMNDGWSLATHVVAQGGEFSLTMMTFSAAYALRKSATDKSYTPKFYGSVVAFVLFALASGLAQWFIASGHIPAVDTHGQVNIAGLAALVFRVAMVPAVDIAALLFLSVMNFKSLKKFVADQRTRAQSVRELNDAELEIQRAQSTARRREVEEKQDLEMKEQRNAVWLEMDRMNAQNMIADAGRRALPPAPTPTVVAPDEEPASGPERNRVRRVGNGN